MATRAHANRGAFRLGRMMGRAWRGYVCRERHVAHWLVDRGLPTVGAGVLLWSIKVALLAALLYLAFWLTFAFALVVAFGWMAANADLEPQEPKLEWQDGHSGFGLYDRNEWRHDQGDPDRQ
ncbi:DUF3742 family protein [Xanthomonas campestris pv. phormiicola]|nr:DUF3742 family protein [Xanthomonas campestris pv. phormiicola]UYC17407.1 DUF3742 family protein [Xanthomonas campestris pv. phormiicola]